MYRKKYVAYLMILPMLIFLFTFLFYPFFINIKNSFMKFESILDKNPTFIGFQNYISMFTDDTFVHSLVNTLILVILVLVFQVGIALVLAFLVNSVVRLSSFYKLTFFMPIVVSATALGLMFNLFYDYNYGMFNQILIKMGKEIIFWKDPQNLTRLYTLIVSPVIWQYIGFYFIIFLTGLTDISKEVTEAAEIDGCNSIQKIMYVQIPMLRNVTRTVIVLAITGTLKVFDLPHIINPNGYPMGKNHFLGTYMYDKGFNTSDIGFAAAFAVFIVIAGVLLSLVANSVFKQNKDL